VARIKAQAANTQADAEAYRVIASAQAEAKRLKIEAEARAEATRMEAEAEAGATRIKAQADAQVIDQFAREMELRRLEVNRIKAFGSKTVFVPSDGTGAQMGNAMAVGMAASLGAQAAQRK
jgi:regulator of protease activity HflC (stomatin/prohibitin superfamily)